MINYFYYIFLLGMFWGILGFMSIFGCRDIPSLIMVGIAFSVISWFIVVSPDE